MNIIFLDIDGVLIPNSEQGLPPTFERESRIEAYLNPKSIALVNKLAADNNAEIVVSSSWRFHDKDLASKGYEKSDSILDLRSFLQRSGLTAEFANDWHTPKPTRFSDAINGRPRGLEIKDWLDNHPEVKNWVALDDDSSGFGTLNIINHLVKIDSDIGFQEVYYKNAERILKGDLSGWIRQ
jgi:hypothetical protein